jgi:uncharacterized repeat protein (TIGR03803 family)
VLHAFRAGTDGGYPANSGVIRDEKGNLYGTTNGYGKWNDGVVYKLSPSGKETVLHAFQGPPTDGAGPFYGVISDRHGNLYGTTSWGGSSSNCSMGCGIIFKIARNGTESVLHDFCAEANCPDGSAPIALALDKAGNLVGTTEFGGAYGTGVLFRLAPDGTETVLHSFCSQPQCSMNEGGPSGGPVLDSKGNIFGAADGGGFEGSGLIFRLTAGGSFSALHIFCETNCKDGDTPVATPILDNMGNLYGTTLSGGYCGGIACGTVFRIRR